MREILDIANFEFENVQVDETWNVGDEKELKIHKIHSYPAKFPAFITTKALSYCEELGLEVKCMADIFCGCGTSAFEAKRNNIDFWGCDINPVATLIAQTKSDTYNVTYIRKYLKEILGEICESREPACYEAANERIRYWYNKEQFIELSKIKKALEKVLPPKSKYKKFFLCAFSNTLKPTSKWLTKSIKPQVDPDKIIAAAVPTFQKQCDYMIDAVLQIEKSYDSNVYIKTGDFLDTSLQIPNVDLVVTSPPYVTSYEYADLHQLSSLWLDYTDDHRKLREGSVGSLYHQSYNCLREWRDLNQTGEKIVLQLYSNDKSKSKSVAKYFLDMQKVASKVYQMLNPNGVAVFVIGNTEYKGVRMDNAKHLVESLYNSGFDQVLASKRKISNKFLTPYRDENGKFSSDKSGRKIYSEEFIIVGRKLGNEQK